MKKGNLHGPVRRPARASDGRGAGTGAEGPRHRGIRHVATRAGSGDRENRGTDRALHARTRLPVHRGRPQHGAGGHVGGQKASGLSEEEFVSRYGFGVSTFYTGLPPQLSTGYSPARVGLGERNVQIFRKLSPADQVAYNRALLGDDVSSTFAVALEIEDLSRTGGCTRKALTETFKPDQLKASHYNPQDALINKDQRMKAAMAYWQREMKKAGFEYGHSDEIEPDLRNWLIALTEGGKLLVSKMSQDQKAALRKLQDYERLVSAKSFKMQEEVLTPVEEKIQEELFSRKVQ